MTLPLPMPDLDASEEEWNLKRLTLDELAEVIAIFERLQHQARKKWLELEEQHQSIVAAA